MIRLANVAGLPVSVRVNACVTKMTVTAAMAASVRVRRHAVPNAVVIPMPNRIAVLAMPRVNVALSSGPILIVTSALVRRSRGTSAFLRMRLRSSREPISLPTISLTRSTDSLSTFCGEFQLVCASSKDDRHRRAP